MAESGVNGWNKWGLHIQKELARLTAEAAKRDGLIQTMRIEEAARRATQEACREDMRQNTRMLVDLKDIILPALQSSINSLKVKAGLWGAVAGALPTAIAIIYGLATQTP